MSAELRDAQYTIDDLDEGVDTSFQPAFDEDTDDDTGECKQIERLPHLRHSEEIQLLCSNVLVKDPTGLALREFLSDLEAGEVYTNETYIKALCDWKLAKGTIDYDILEIPRVISDAVRLEQYGLEVQRYAKRLETHAFNLIDIVAAVFEKLNILDGQALAVRTLLNYAVDSCSELLLLGAVQLETPWMPIECDTINNLLEVYYRSENKVPRLFVLGSLWQANRDALTSFLIEKYNSKPMEIHQIAQLITELGVAPSLVNIRPYKFALDLFTNLSVCGEFSITRYLTSVIISANVEFTIDMLGHLDALINDSSKRYTIGLKEVYEFLRVLSELSIPLSCMDQWDRVREQCVLAYPRLVAYGRDLDLILIFNQNISSEFSESIIAEVDAKIEDLRNCRVHVSEAIEYLRILRKSASPVAQDLAACMMSLMFKWYQNLSELPLKDVAIFSTFMGLLIKHRLIVGTHLTVALEWIVRSLSTDVPDSKVFKAAANTAMQLVDALDICPDQFSETLAGLDSLANFAPDIWRVARDTKARQNLAVEYCRTGKPKSDVKEDLEVPVSATKHKIQDIMQSLTSNRVRIVATELESALHDEKCTNWFVDYLVGTLVVQNLSQCDTYLELLNAIKSDELNSMVLRRTYHISLTLIKSDESTHLASAMAKLYNLGTWLGKYTLARNKPIKTNHLCFKKLLRLGGEIDRVRVVVGFTCKVLEQAGNSVVFKRSNPWVMGVLRTLLEVYAHKVGDAMWKSDIEGLFKSLGADMAKVATTARAEETKTGVNEAHTDDVVANFDLISKTIDKKVAQIRGFMKNTVDIMWHKCIGFVEPPQPCMLVVINYVEESMERSLSEGHESPAALEEAKKQIEEGAEYCRDELYKQNIEQQAAAVFSACLERNGYSSYITSDHSSILEQEMDAVRTHLYDLIYNRITKEVNRSLPAIMQGTIYSPLKLYTAQDIHHPGQSEAEKISPVESEADGSIMRVMEVPDSPKKRPEVISIGRNDDRDEFRMARFI
ncbi:hypothetical protein V1520DRAFT_281849 [Lipomyces starkeyi]|uniref:Uncharacterized protein n=1 Tax=Lipomyces starkeyi NRRL Y-11557 TaxID=675824 RepID=A0A1E3QBL4_LIPST|nr:hypothetical protein LIPSTDRAFT_238441 [Lipomyces starkeyi NRRL Y-11557]